MAIPRDRAISYVEKHIVPIEFAVPFLKILVYGRNGTEKTRFACSGPKTLVIDIDEEGTKSARKMKGGQVFLAKRWQEVVWAYWYLKSAEHDYEVVAVDTITAMQNVCMKQVLKEGAERDPNKDPKVASMREWGKVAQLMKEQLLNFRNLPMHVVFVAQERVIDDPDSETTERVPDLSPGSRATATACVDIIGRMYKREVRTVSKTRKKEESKWEPRMLVGPHEEYVTKDRTGVLGRVMRSPSIPKILELAELGGTPDGSEKKRKWEVE